MQGAGSSAALDALRAAADRYAETAAAERTRAARTADWNAFDVWCTQHALTALPAHVDTAPVLPRGTGALRPSCLDHPPRTLLDRDAATSSMACRARTGPAAREVERGIARVIGTRETGAAPVLPHQLAQIVVAFGDKPREVRDRALLVFGFAGGFRTSELVALRVDDFTFSERGVIVAIRRGREDQLGRGADTELLRSAQPATCPVHALERWLDQLGRPAAGPLFSRIDDDLVRDQAMSERATSRAVQRAAARAGLVGKFSSHSLRAGLCTSAAATGSTNYDIGEALPHEVRADRWAIRAYRTRARSRERGRRTPLTARAAPRPRNKIMANWHCDACGQRIFHAREGWTSLRCDQRDQVVPALVHHASAAPLAVWGGYAAGDEVASIHLVDALRDELELELLAEIGLLNLQQLSRLRVRLHAETSDCGRASTSSKNFI